MIQVVPGHLLQAMGSVADTRGSSQPSVSKNVRGEFDIVAWLGRHLPDAIGPTAWNGGEKWILPVCPFNPDHTNRSAYVIKQQSGALVAGCHHAGCQGNGWKELRAMLDPPRIHDTVGKIDERETGNVSKEERFTINRISSREMDSGDYTTNFLVENVLAEHQPLVIAAPLKTLKTTIAVALGISLAIGREFLGRFWVDRACNVLIMSGESGLSSLQSAGRRIAASHGFSLGDVGRLYWATDLPQLGNSEHLEALRESLVRDEIEVVIIDPLYFCLPGADAGNLMIVGAHLRALTKVCQECGVTPIVVHHIKKTGIENRHEPAELSHISWSGTAEWARQWILLNRRKDYVPGSGEHKLWMVTGGSAGHSGLHAINVFEGVGDDRTWQVDILSADEVREADETAKDRAKDAKQRDQLDRDQRKVLDVMLQLSGHQGTKTEIKDRTARNSQAFNLAVAALLASGDLIECEITKGNNRSYPGYRLRNDNE